MWLSAAVGIACGGELYFSATLSTALVSALLRFGPRMEDDRQGDGSVNFPPSVYAAMYNTQLSAGESERQRDEENEDTNDDEETKLLARRSLYMTERPRPKPRFSSLV